MSNNWDYQKVANTKKWIFLDLQSTVDFLCNTGLLKTIQKTDDHKILKKNTVSTKFNQKVYIEGYV